MLKQTLTIYGILLQVHTRIAAIKAKAHSKTAEKTTEVILCISHYLISVYH